MKQVLVLFTALALVSAAAAVPFDVKPMTSDARWKIDPDFEIIDSGSGDTAAIIVARKAAFAPFADSLLLAGPSMPRVIAFLIDGQSADAIYGPDGLARPIADAIAMKELRLACVVSCGDCVGVAARLVESIDRMSALVLLSGSQPPVLPMTKAVFFATDAGDSLSAAVDRALGIVELEPVRSFRGLPAMIPR